MSRDLVVYSAITLLGDYVTGSPEVYDIWRDVLPPEWTDAQVHQYAKTKSWCGGLALRSLRLGGVTDAHWKDGIGFIGPLGLHVTHKPQPGDIAVKERPFQHHMVVQVYNGPSDWWDCAGNTPTAAQHHHTSIDGITFYSIDALLEKPT